MTLLELTLETAINEAGEFKDVRLSKEDAEHILSMLKEQEAVEPRVEYDAEDDCHWCACGKCGKKIDWDDKFCKHCGQAVKVK